MTTAKRCGRTVSGIPDVFYTANIIPERPGLETAYGYEDRQPTNGIQVADARTGQMIWGHPNPTLHIHDWGMFADVDAANPGYEFYAAEQKRELGRFLHSARDGTLLSTDDLGSITLNPVYWLDGPQKVHNGELRIATTTVPSTTRHVNLMQDSLYRNDVAHTSMGYFYPPNTSYPLFPEAFK